MPRSCVPGTSSARGITGLTRCSPHIGYWSGCHQPGQERIDWAWLLWSKCCRHWRERAEIPAPVYEFWACRKSVAALSIVLPARDPSETRVKWAFLTKVTRITKAHARGTSIRMGFADEMLRCISGPHEHGKERLPGRCSSPNPARDRRPARHSKRTQLCRHGGSRQP